MTCEMLETTVIPDIYADGIGSVDNLGSNFRTTYYVWAREVPDADEPLRRFVVARIIRPKSSILRPNGAIVSWLAIEERGPAEARMVAGARGH